MENIGNFLNALMNGSIRVENASLGSWLTALFFLWPLIATVVVSWRFGRRWAGLTFVLSIFAWIGIVWLMSAFHWGFYAPATESLRFIALPLLG